MIVRVWGAEVFGAGVQEERRKRKEERKTGRCFMGGLSRVGELEN